MLLQLPAPQLKNVFELSPDLREPLLEQVQSFTPHQRAHITKAVITVLEKDPAEEQRAAERARKEEQEMAEQEKLYQAREQEKMYQVGVRTTGRLPFRLPAFNIFGSFCVFCCITFILHVHYHYHHGHFKKKNIVLV